VGYSSARGEAACSSAVLSVEDALPDHVVRLAGFVAMVLFVIVSLDRPFHGAMAIPADSYQLIYDQLMKR
jgi:hypothetical protein